MLLDEPFASLDPNLRTRLRADIVDILRTTRTPALFVTHDQTEALTVGDRVAVMRAGRIEQLGSPDDVFHRPANRFVAGFMGDAAFLPVRDGRTELGQLAGERLVADGALVVVRPHAVAVDGAHRGCGTAGDGRRRRVPGTDADATPCACPAGRWSARPSPHTTACTSATRCGHGCGRASTPSCPMTRDERGGDERSLLTSSALEVVPCQA